MLCSLCGNHIKQFKIIGKSHFIRSSLNCITTPFVLKTIKIRKPKIELNNHDSLSNYFYFNDKHTEFITDVVVYSTLRLLL